MTRLEFYRSACVREVNLVTRYIAKKQDYPMKNGGRNHCGFLYTLEGTETYRFSDKTLDTPPHSITFIPRGEVYSIDFCEEQSVVIAFDFELVDAPQIRPFCVRLSKDNPLRTLFSDAETRWLLKKPECETDAKSAFYKIVSYLIKNELYYASGENRMKIAEAIAYLHAHYLETDFRVSMLSQIAKISPRYFEMLFFGEFKCTPKEYILSLKMQLARELLQSEKYTVTDVAGQLGYGDIYHFSKIFKSKTGYTPSEYKRLGATAFK
jgi:AraC-like DNA-binding protein